MGIRSAAGCEGVGNGEDLVGGTEALLKRFYGTEETVPVCPSGGVYRFWSDTTYNGYKDIECSIHKWEGEGEIPDQLKGKGRW